MIHDNKMNELSLWVQRALNSNLWEYSSVIHNVVTEIPEKVFEVGDYNSAPHLGWINKDGYNIGGKKKKHRTCMTYDPIKDNIDNR